MLMFIFSDGRLARNKTGKLWFIVDEKYYRKKENIGQIERLER